MYKDKRKRGFELGFRLESYSGPDSRHVCPSCGRPRQFSYYINSATGHVVDNSVGRCNREVNCGYHKTPGEFFKEQQTLINGRTVNKREWLSASSRQPRSKDATQRFDCISADVVEQSLSHYDQNHLAAYLADLFTVDVVKGLIERFAIGTSKYWPGATILWQVDRNERVRTGKVMLYNPETGHRVKEPFSHFHWAHRLLKLVDFQLRQCLFGEDQLRYEPIDKPVSIVESEKTAIIASVYMPEYIWMATGGISGLSAEKFQALEGRDIVLWPDLNAYDKWEAKAQAIEQEVNCNLQISKLLEERASDQDRQKGYDIADYLVRRDADYGWALSDEEYPLFWDLAS
ncbi:DUF6371 domain-containing protein [Larkinella ripae]